MFLKAIEIHGFKSFANKTVLDFLPSKDGKHSVTAIVGPNGSGKSNVSDAIRWVLGEQSMKQLRGKKSHDVIFSGSTSKGQMSMASVSLIIDNNDHRAPIDYDELVITRRLYRSGESEYLVNGNETRLFDIQLLLAKAQFGQGSYSIVGQGMIDRMLLQSPEERKVFFDEAAGIKEFQLKRHQAYLKMTRSREHITQADALLQEIIPRLKTLTRQVKKLEERHIVEADLRESQEQYYVTLSANYRGQQNALQGELSAILEKYEALQAELEAVQVELAALAHAASRQDVFQALQQEYQRITREKHRIERERAVLQGKLQTEYAKVGRQQLGWIENKITELTASQEQFQRDTEEGEKEREQSEISLREKKSEHDQLIVSRSEIKTAVARLQQQMVDAKGQETVWRMGGLQAVEAVLSLRNKFGFVYGAVASLGRVAAQYQLALDVAAGANLSSLIVENDSVAQACIRFLREERLGIATFLPLNKIRGRIIPQDVYQYLNTDGVHGLAIDLVKFDSRYEEIFLFVFGETLVVENVDVARRIGIGRFRMVTLDGDILEKSGSMKGGYRKKREGGLSFSDTNIGGYVDGDQIVDTIKKTQDELEQLDRNIESVQAAIRELETHIHVLREKDGLLLSRKHDIASELAALEQERALQTMSPEEYTNAMHAVQNEKVRLEEQLLDFENQVKAVELKIEQFNAEEEEKKQRVFALQDTMQDRQQSLNLVGEKRHELQVQLAKLETKLEDIDHEAYQELHTSLASVLERGIQPVAMDQLEHLQQHIQKLKYSLSLIGGIDEEVVKEYEETKVRHDELSLQLTDLTKAVNDLETLIEELDVIMKKKRSKAFAQIKKEFSRYFKILFEGGDADLVEVYGDEDEGGAVDGGDVPAEGMEDEENQKKSKAKKILKGIDVVACPPGKKIKNIQMLSGGERTMASIALICAILYTNPSPFVVLDEVEAALDEANSMRLTSILKELATQSQFILITHNRATMHAADALYGVTMGNDGVSRLVSVKLEGEPLDN